jgi:AraC family transcriptional regulator of adaptative response / DNA-3-methyladenine glycosylase II
MPKARQRALRSLAETLADDPSTVEQREELLALPGIGPWTVSYVAMRALGDPDAFLANDLGIRHALERLDASADVAERWRPYRAYAAQHLWATL